MDLKETLVTVTVLTVVTVTKKVRAVTVVQ